MVDRARAQGGRIHRRQLRGLGLSDRQVDRRLASGRLVPSERHRGVFVVGAVAPSHLGTAWEALLAVGGDAMLTGLWGCWWSGLVARPFGDVDIATTSQAGRGLEGIRLHRPRRIAPGERLLIEGVPTASANICLLALARRKPALLPRALNEAQRQLVDVGDLRAYAKGRLGGQVLLAAMDAHVPEQERTREELELRAVTMLTQRGAPLYVPNARVTTAEREYEVDGLYERERLVVELQSEAHHSTPAERRRDRTKANALAAAGYGLLQWDWQDVTREPATTVARLLRVLADRRARGAPTTAAVAEAPRGPSALAQRSTSSTWAPPPSRRT